MQLLSVITIASVLGVLACSSSGELSSKHARSNRDIISAEEIQESGANNAYDLIRGLRPHWLQGRGRKSILHNEVSYPLVYVNGNEHGPIDSLWRISVENITKIQYLNPGDAANQLGMNHPSGAILITMFE
jgi:hypothetical protein